MRVIGYFTSWDKELKIDQIKYKYLTHINYAFLIPKKDGSVVELDNSMVYQLIHNAHKNNVKVFISVGGWCYENSKLDVIFEEICSDNDKLNHFINNILNIVKKYNFDGVDIDWEYPTDTYINEYEYLLFRLKSKLKTDNKELSIAIPPGINIDGTISNISAITSKVLNIVDWINLMVYDNEKEENHSSYHYAKLSLEYWIDKRKYDKEKIVLGLPFYTRPSNITYRDILMKNLGDCKKDNFGNEFYNGSNTIRSKVCLAREKGVGVMIWALNYDVLDSKSLLKVINMTLMNDKKL